MNVTFICDVCKQSYHHGMGRYEGHKLSLYGNIFCCQSCWDNNWDGWGPNVETVLLEHLKVRNILPPPRNEKGFLPRN